MVVQRIKSQLLPGKGMGASIDWQRSWMSSSNCSRLAFWRNMVRALEDMSRPATLRPCLARYKVFRPEPQPTSRAKPCKGIFCCLR